MQLTYFFSFLKFQEDMVTKTHSDRTDIFTVGNSGTMRTRMQPQRANRFACCSNAWAESNLI